MSNSTGRRERGIVHLAALDTEDDSRGNPLLFGIVSESGALAFSSASDALLALDSMARAARARGAVCEVWATNLEYDLVNLFGRERIREVTLRFGKSHLVAATWRGLHFRDTLRHIPASVKELGQLVGLAKLERDPTSTAYMLRDAAITYRAARLIHDTFNDFGVLPRSTLPATAYRIWERTYWRQGIRLPCVEVWEGAKAAYHGGRTEPFAIGEFRGVQVIDAASMFPWAMLAGPFPIVWGPFRRAWGARLEPSGVYRVEVESELARPVLPYRTGEGTVYPNGRFSGWYVGEELLAFHRRGGKVKILEGYEFLRHARPFDGYVAELFRRKQSSRGAMRSLYKLMLNALYGKFGQGGERAHAIPLEAFERLKTAPLDYRVWCGMALYRTETAPPPWGNNVWAALVTARARVRLLEELERVERAGGRALYVDTDSVMFTGPPLPYPEKVTEPGRFELRGRFRRLLVVGKKEYGLEDAAGRWEVHAKGIPAAERENYLRNGRAAFELPYRIREAARVGGAANVWRRVEKVRRVSFKDRSRKPDGSLLPVLVTEHGDTSPA